MKSETSDLTVENSAKSDVVVEIRLPRPVPGRFPGARPSAASRGSPPYGWRTSFCALGREGPTVSVAACAPEAPTR